MIFIPKNYIRLEQAMVEAGPLVVNGWSDDDLDAVNISSPEGVRRKELVTWFRRELQAESFICTYRSTGEEFTNIPANVFVLDDSEGLFAIDQTSAGQSSAPVLATFPDGSIDFVAGALTWIDASRPIYQLEFARGQELFILNEGFKRALVALDPVETKKALGKKEKRKAKVALVVELIKEIWPKGITSGLSWKERNKEINLQAKVKGHSQISDRTIARALSQE